jgi:hypothetical protein
LRNPRRIRYLHFERYHPGHGDRWRPYLSTLSGRLLYSLDFQCLQTDWRLTNLQRSEQPWTKKPSWSFSQRSEQPCSPTNHGQCLPLQRSEEQPEKRYRRSLSHCQSQQVSVWPSSSQRSEEQPTKSSSQRSAEQPTKKPSQRSGEQPTKGHCQLSHGSQRQ